jgi:hypothetical protein
VALLDIAAGHFGRLELASPEIALPFVREIAMLARTTVERIKKPVKFPVSLGTDLSTPSVAQSSVMYNCENNNVRSNSQCEIFP